DGAGTPYLPSGDRRGKAFDPDSTEIAVLEEIAAQLAGCRRDHDSIRLGERLQPGGEVRRFTDDRLLLRRAFADQIADDHDPRGDADASLQIKATHGTDHTQRCADRPLGIVLVRLRVAEINQDPVTHVFGDKAVKRGTDLGDSAMVGTNDLAKILRIEL